MGNQSPILVALRRVAKATGAPMLERRRGKRGHRLDLEARTSPLGVSGKPPDNRDLSIQKLERLLADLGIPASALSISVK